MMKKFKDVFTLFLLLIIMLGCSAPRDEVCFGDKCISVSVAQTEASRVRGLQFVSDLCDDCGMLFIFEQGKKYGFWMKDTLIPLDIIWLDRTRRIVHIEKNVPVCREDPCTAYYPDNKSFYVVELNSGKADSLGIKKGDVVELRLLNRKK